MLGGLWPPHPPSWCPKGTHAAAPRYRERLELRGAGLLGAVPSARPSTWQWTGAETRGTFSPHLPRCASEARGSGAETCLSPPFQVRLGLGFPMAESRVEGPVPLTRHEERGCPSACPGPGTRGPPTGTPHSRVTTLATPRLPRPGSGRPRDTVPSCGTGTPGHPVTSLSPLCGRVQLRPLRLQNRLAGRP